MKKTLVIILSLFNVIFFANAQSSLENDYKVYKLNSVSQNVSEIVKQKIITNFMSEASLTENGEYDLVNMELGSFDSTDIQAVYVKGINRNSSTVLVFYVKGDLVSDMAVKEILATDADNNPIVIFKDRVGETVFDVKTTSNGGLTIKTNPSYIPTEDVGYNNQELNYMAKNGPSLNTQQMKSFWDRWTSCISTALTQMSNGHSTAATIAGLGCMAAGAYCAGGAVVGCAAHAAVFH